MINIVVFGDPRDIAARVLIPGLLQEISEHPELKCSALYLSAQGANSGNMLHYWLGRLTRKLQLLLGSGRPEKALQQPLLAVRALQKKYSVPVIVMPDGNPNHPAILKQLEQGPSASFAFNIYCKNLFRKPLLSRFQATVNYHNGSLPRFRGTRASNWSIYHGLSTSGYTFHYMDHSFDTGNTLFSDEVAVLPLETPADLELRKAQAARHNLPRVLDLILRHEPGQVQAGIGCEHTRQAYRLATQVADPSTLSSEEWKRRLNAFLQINTLVLGKWWAVTAIEPSSEVGKLSFCTADGYWFRISCINFWPVWINNNFRKNK